MILLYNAIQLEFCPLETDQPHNTTPHNRKSPRYIILLFYLFHSIKKDEKKKTDKKKWLFRSLQHFNLNRLIEMQVNIGVH